MWIKLIPALLIGCVALSGCGAKTEVSYQTPQNHPFDNSTVYDAGLETVWDAVFRSIEASAFTLDQVRREVRTITLSFTADTPSAYVDCGVLTYATGDETFTVEGAAAEGRYLYADGESPAKEVARRVTLEGKAEISLSVEEKNTTRVTVKTRYTVGVVNKGYMPVTYGYSEGFMPQSLDSSVVFGGGQTGSMHGGGLTQCVSTSALEREILESIRAALGSRP